MTTCVPLWQYITVTLGLLTSNATLFFIFKRRVETLQMALVAKRVLLTDSGARRPIGNGRYDLLAGEMLKLAITQQIGAQTFSTDVHIDMHTPASMTVTY